MNQIFAKTFQTGQYRRPKTFLILFFVFTKPQLDLIQKLANVIHK